MSNDNNGYDPSELQESAESAESAELPTSGTIEKIRRTTVGEAYSSMGSPPSERVNIENPDNPAIEVVVPIEVEGETVEVTDVFAYPQTDLSWHNPNFKLGNFRDYYGNVPEEGMDVEVELNDETGFWGIVY